MLLPVESAQGPSWELGKNLLFKNTLLTRAVYLCLG